MRDGQTGEARFFAGRADDLGDLIGAEPAGGTGSGRVTQDFLDGSSKLGVSAFPLDRGDRSLRIVPASSPQPDLPAVELNAFGNRDIEKAFGREQDDFRPLCKPLAGGRCIDELRQNCFDVVQDDDIGCLPWHRKSFHEQIVETPFQ